MNDNGRVGPGFALKLMTANHAEQKATALARPENHRNRVDDSVPHPARRYNYLLGGKDNFAADRDSAHRIEAIYPNAARDARENRKFILRATRHLVKDLGVTQFLDIGTGIPLPPTVHEVAQKVDPGARVAYADNDPLVMAHARARLVGGATTWIEADLREPHALMRHPGMDRLDLGEPVALILGAVLHFIADDRTAQTICTELISHLTPGSYLVLSHFTTGGLDPDTAERINALDEGEFRARAHGQITDFFAGLRPIDPGLCPVNHWHPEENDHRDSTCGIFGGVARLP